MLRSIRIALLSALIILGAGCGFQMRGSYTLPFESIYISGPEHSLTTINLKRAIRSSNARLADNPKEAEAIFIPTGEFRMPIILSLSSSGRVRERRLRYVYGYRVTNNRGQDLIPPSTIELTRDLTYADSAVLAKEQEEALLWQDMEQSLIQQLMRRLSAAKLQTIVAE